MQTSLVARLYRLAIVCNQLKSLEVAFNNILRRIWRLPRNTHTRILHKVAHLDSIYNRVIKLTDCFSRESKSRVLHDTFHRFYTNAFTPVGNSHYASLKYRKFYSEEDISWVCSILAAQQVHRGIRHGRWFHNKDCLLWLITNLSNYL